MAVPHIVFVKYISLLVSTVFSEYKLHYFDRKLTILTLIAGELPFSKEPKLIFVVFREFPSLNIEKLSV